MILKKNPKYKNLDNKILKKLLKDLIKYYMKQ
jgi:hypothetical protein